MIYYILPFIKEYILGIGVAYADLTDKLPKPEDIPTGDNDTFLVLIGKVINFFLEMVGLVLLIAILYAGAQMLTAQGDEEKVKNSRQIIVYGIIGVIILALSFVIVRWLLTGESPLADTN